MVELFPSQLSLCLVGAQGLTEERHYKGSCLLLSVLEAPDRTLEEAVSLMGANLGLSCLWHFIYLVAALSFCLLWILFMSWMPISS